MWLRRRRRTDDEDAGRIDQSARKSRDRRRGRLQVLRRSLGARQGEPGRGARHDLLAARPERDREAKTWTLALLRHSTGRTLRGRLASYCTARRISAAGQSLRGG